MKKVFDLIKNRYFLYPLMGVTFLFNFVGLVCQSVEDGFEAALLFEMLILGIMYFFLIYSLRKNHYKTFTALVLMIFTYDSIYFVTE
ncbi:MAG: hypothetical protein MJ208_04340, partial [Bacilli bacterium]|nr:hypothetical protein [Bacilli bacterium]